MLKSIDRLITLVNNMLDYGTCTIGASEGPQLFLASVEFIFVFSIMLIVSQILFKIIKK